MIHHRRLRPEGTGSAPIAIGFSPQPSAQLPDAVETLACVPPGQPIGDVAAKAMPNYDSKQRDSGTEGSSSL